MRYLWAIAAGLVITFGCDFVEDLHRSSGRYITPRMLSNSKQDMHLIANELKTYKKKYRHYPSSEEGLAAIQEQLAEKQKSNAEYQGLRVAPSSVLSPWGEPFIYENRLNKSANAFSASGVEQDAEGIYSLRVDKGIYIWSLAGQQKHQLLSYWQPRLRLGYPLVYMLSFACLVCFFIACYRRISREEGGVDKPVAYFMSILGGLTAAFLSLSFTLRVQSCYVPSTRWRINPQLTQDYTTIMRKYRENGAISDKAYNKLMKAVAENEELSIY